VNPISHCPDSRHDAKADLPPDLPICDLLACASRRTLASLMSLGSQMGSQCQQTPVHIRRQRAMVSAATSLIGPQPATWSDRADAPETRKVGARHIPVASGHASHCYVSGRC
jgi:hypothetical protein